MKVKNILLFNLKLSTIACDSILQYNTMIQITYFPCTTIFFATGTVRWDTSVETNRAESPSLKGLFE